MKQLKNDVKCEKIEAVTVNTYLTEKRTCMNSFYGDYLFILQSALNNVLSDIELIRAWKKSCGYRDPVEHCKGRIKSEESMIDKLKRKNMKPTLDNARSKIFDAVGVRIVCNFVDDVYEIRDIIKSLSSLQIIQEKDYIAAPKPNGYRSYHLIVKTRVNIPGRTLDVPAEIQIRTIAQDSWAALEHQLKYKQEIDNMELLQKELKRCSDEMASTDLTMQTVRQMINGEIK